MRGTLLTSWTGRGPRPRMEVVFKYKSLDHDDARNDNNDYNDDSTQVVIHWLTTQLAQREDSSCRSLFNFEILSYFVSSWLFFLNLPSFYLAGFKRKHPKCRRPSVPRLPRDGLFVFLFVCLFVGWLVCWFVCLFVQIHSQNTKIQMIECQRTGRQGRGAWASGSSCTSPSLTQPDPISGNLLSGRGQSTVRISW